MEDERRMGFAARRAARRWDSLHGEQRGDGIRCTESSEAPVLNRSKRHYDRLIRAMLLLEEPNKERCYRLVNEHKARLLDAQGSSYNHQSWPGGYVEHVADVMHFAVHLYEAAKAFRPLTFQLHEALLVLFLHDIEKPWKGTNSGDWPWSTHDSFRIGGLWSDKAWRRGFRLNMVKHYRIELTAEQENALCYVEGEGDDYRSDRRVMNEMAAFCHMCDVASARIWHSPRPQCERCRMLDADDQQKAEIARLSRERDAALEKAAKLRGELRNIEKERDELKVRLAHAEADAEQAVYHAERERDEARTEISRFRGALEEIADGVGCDSKHGPGCDWACKRIARKALTGGES